MNKRIVCPYKLIWRWNHEYSDCRSIRCCFVCKKKGECKKSTCGVFHQAMSPEHLKSCSTYPITASQAKSFFILFKLTVQKEEDWRDEYLDELRVLVVPNRWRRRMGYLH